MTAPLLPHAPPESVGLNPERLKRLSAAMAREIEEGKAPGLSMLLPHLFDDQADRLGGNDDAR